MARQVLGEWAGPAQGSATTLAPGQPHRHRPPTSSRETQPTPAFQPSVPPRHGKIPGKKKRFAFSEKKINRDKTTTYKTTPFELPKMASKCATFVFHSSHFCAPSCASKKHWRRTCEGCWEAEATFCTQIIASKEDCPGTSPGKACTQKAKASKKDLQPEAKGTSHSWRT